MKITEVAKKCRALSEKNLYDCELDRAEAYEHCADMLETTILKIREELDKLNADAKNRDFSVMLEWVLGEDKK